MQPLAIIVPAYKARFLAETLDSIASQSEQSFHCYVFDDASPEPLAAIVDRFSSRLPVTYIRFEENVGGRDLVAQWDRCLTHTEEPWIWFVPDDDILEAGCVAAVMRGISEADDVVALLRFSITTISEHGKVLRVRPENPARESARTLMRASLLGRRPFTLGENIFRRTAYNDVGGFVSFGGGSGSDLSLILKLANHGRVVNLTGPRFRFRHHAAAISSGASQYQQQAVAGVRDCCLWLTEWNDRERIASKFLVRYWTMRWYHACLKHWAGVLTEAERNDIARFAHQQWRLPRAVHDRILFSRVTPR